MRKYVDLANVTITILAALVVIGAVILPGTFTVALNRLVSGSLGWLISLIAAALIAGKHIRHGIKPELWSLWIEVTTTGRRIVSQAGK